MSPLLRLLSLGHSYVVGANRKLAEEMKNEGKGRWEVTVAAPAYFHGGKDLGPRRFRKLPGETCEPIPIRTFGSRYVHSFTYSWSLRNLLREPWDVVHCWEEPYVVAGGQVALWSFPLSRLVYRTAQSTPKNYPSPFNWIERYAMNRATGWIYSGQTVLENLKNRPGYRDKPARLIPLGVDTRVFCPNPEAKREILRELEWEKSQAPVIGYVGRFVPEKGLSLLMRVLGQLQTSWRALFVGAGRMESKLRSWAQSHGDRVRIVTDAGHAEMPAYYNAMDLLCAPSQTTTHWREQFGRMLIEAFACGVPVIGSDSGEIPYVVGDTGVIVDEKDEDLWVKNIEELLGDVGRRQYLARVGRERAEQKYAWPLVAKQHLDFFEELLNETHRLSR